MPLKKLVLKPGIDRETTSYTSEGGWYDGDKIRFRSGSPEKIGGWERISDKFFLGTCRSLFNWSTLAGLKQLAVGTHKKFYIEMGSRYYDVTPIRSTTGAGDVTFTASNGSSTVTVNDTAHGATAGDFVTFSGAATLGGNMIGTGNVATDVLNQEYEILTVPTSNTYTIQARSANTSIESITTAAGAVGVPVTATGGDSGNGGSNTVGTYQLNIGNIDQAAITGWNAGTWGEDAWDHSSLSTDISAIRIWTSSNFGQNLIFGYEGSPLYYWVAANGLTTRGVLLSTQAGASNTPTTQNHSLVSDNRFVFCFGVNPLGSGTIDPMLVRWSNQEDPANWTPSAENQAGSLPLSRGTEIVTAKQGRQEILVWTDAALYSFQFAGGQIVWTSQLVGENISIISKSAATYAAGIAFWMGKDKFYVYDGTTKPLNCKVRKYVFDDINMDQADQFFGGTNEAFNEVWWFYCSASSNTIDKYVVYNYTDDTWYYGTLARTAWLDTGVRDHPVAATSGQNLVDHEKGIDNRESAVASAISASVESAQFDLDDGHQFMFIWRVMPDIRFDGSTSGSPAVTMSLSPMINSGSGYNNPLSEGGSNSGAITRTATLPIEKYTGQINTRVRGRQVVLKVESSGAGTQWQLGAPRIDMRPDGRR